MYANIAKEFYSKVANRGQDSRIALHEYYRDDWTFHAKGLWYYMPGESGYGRQVAIKNLSGGNGLKKKMNVSSCEYEFEP